MKKRIPLFIILSFFLVSYSQNEKKDIKNFSMDDFITIKIRSGYTILGTSSITLQREGLIYWMNPFLANFQEEENKEEAKFIPFQKLDKDKVLNIMKYVYEQKLYEIKKLEVLEGSVIPEGMPIVISFIVHKKFQYTGFNYFICDERVEKLLQMMNELIPKEDRVKFEIKLRCN